MTDKTFDPLKTSLNGKLLIEASAGTGKTYSLMHIILRLLVEEKIQVNEILVVTFMKAAAAELRARLRKLLINLTESLGSVKLKIDDKTLSDQIQLWQEQLGLSQDELREIFSSALDKIDDVSIYTIHSFCQKALKDYAFSSKEPFDFELVDSEDELIGQVAEDFLRREIPKLSEDTRKLVIEFGEDGNDGGGWAQVLKHTASLPKNIPLKDQYRFIFGFEDKECKKEEPVPEEFAEFADKLIEEGNKTLEAIKKQEQLSTFDDLLRQMQEKVTEGEQKPNEFVKKLREKYKAVLIDEFQDTDAVQYSIFRNLFITQDADPNRPVIFVGDPKQSIYAFRSAELDTYTKAKEEIGNTLQLNTNYRSAPGLIAGVNAFFSVADNSFINKKLGFSSVNWTNTKKIPYRKEEDGTNFALPSFELWTNQRAVNTKAATVHNFEEKAIAQDIYKTITEENYIGDKRVTPGDIVILTPKRALVAGLIKELSALGIRTLYKSRDSIMATEEKQEILSVLRSMENPKDTRLLAAACSTKIFGYTLKDIKENEELVIKSRLLIEKAAEIFSSKGLVSSFAYLFRSLDADARLLKLKNGERVLTNYQHLLDLAFDASKTHQTISGLIRWLSNPTGLTNDDVVLRRDTDADIVKVETIHSSKGLEYPIVYMLGGISRSIHKTHLFKQKDENDNYFLTFVYKAVNQDAIGNQYENESEELNRLTYVAMTRASSRLVVPLFFRTTSKKLAHASSIKNGLVQVLTGTTSTAANLLHTALEDTLISLVGEKDKEIRELIKEEAPGKFSNEDKYHGISLKFFDLEDVLVMPPRLKQTPIKLSSFEPTRQYSDWIRTSFTGLTRNLDPLQVSPALDEAAEDETAPIKAETSSETAEEDPLSFANGRVSAAIFGDSLHKLLQLINFNWPQETKNTIATWWSSNSPVKPDESNPEDLNEQVEILQHLVENIAAVKPFKRMPEFSLSKLGPKEKFAEMEFLLSIGGHTEPSRRPLTAELLAKTLKTLDPKYEKINLNDEHLKGFLTGSIDLVFYADGKFWIIDWKSNYVAEKPSDYTPEIIEETMDKKLYKLQYLLYLIALKRIVECKMQVSDGYKLIGGTAYYFLRGVNADNPDQGIYFDRPSDALIACVDEFLDKGYDEDRLKYFLELIKETNNAD